MELTMEERRARRDGLVADTKACDRCLCDGLIDVDSRKEINLWNYWQGALDARLMLIGQDFGNALTQKCTVEEMRRGSPWHDTPVDLKRWAKTDQEIRALFQDILGVDTTRPQKLYFTNAACCYREGKTSGVVDGLDQWLPYCASKYMGRLLRIIRPQAVIVLGERVLEALAFCENSSLTQRPTAPALASLAAKEKGFVRAMNMDYTLTFSDDPELVIHVYPVYHPEYYLKIQDGKEAQARAWTAIKDRLNALDRSILGDMQEAVG